VRGSQGNEEQSTRMRGCIFSDYEQVASQQRSMLSIFILHAVLPVISSTLQMTISGVTAYHQVFKCGDVDINSKKSVVYCSRESVVY
jgi:hypothetical protein